MIYLLIFHKISRVLTVLIFPLITSVTRACAMSAPLIYGGLRYEKCNKSVINGRKSTPLAFVPSHGQTIEHHA